MIANYGYKDGSGEYFITLDTDRCIPCQDRACVPACPKGLFEIIVDDYDDEVAAVKDTLRRRLQYECMDCKPTHQVPPLPCVTACKAGAISHSW